MKKTLKNAIAFVLCLVMLASVFPVSVFAESAKPEPDYSSFNYKYYTYIGDSISWGYGLDPEIDPVDASNMFIRVEGSFPDRVGKVLEENCGAEVCCAACNGGRLCDYRMLLESGMGVANPYTYPEDIFSHRSIERTQRLQSSGEYVCENLKKSDLVTITLGANDMATCLINVASAFDFIDIEKIQSLTDAKSKLDYAAFAVQAALKQKNMFSDFAEALKNEIGALKENQKKVVKEVVELAPDADILIVGYFIPLDKFRIIPGTDFSLLLELFGTVFTIYNDAFESIASEYPNVYYVDAPEASIFFEDGTLFTDAFLSIFRDRETFLLKIHPDAEGHKYISQKVLEKLVEINDGRHVAAETTVNIPTRTVNYILGLGEKTVKVITQKIKNTISSIFKR